MSRRVRACVFVFVYVYYGKNRVFIPHLVSRISTIFVFVDVNSMVK